jgi:hypothetical protein
MRYLPLLFILLSCWSAAVESTDETSATHGVGTHILGGSRDLTRSLDAISEMGLTSIRDDAPWARVEVRRGEYQIPESWDRVVDAANAKGISVLLILDYGNSFYDGGDKPRSSEAVDAYVKYVQFVVNHFKGRVHRYEIWNEWDSTTGRTTKGSAEDYFNLVRHSFPAIKSIDPHADVLVGAVTADGLEHDFVEKLVALGTLDYADGLSIHPYIKCRLQHSPADWADWMVRIEENLAWRTGKAVPIYVTEMGWPTFAGDCGFAEASQAEFAVGLFRETHSLPFIKGVWWYDLQDDGADLKDREYHYGLLRLDYSPKPAFEALKAASRH